MVLRATISAILLFAIGLNPISAQEAKEKVEKKVIVLPDGESDINLDSLLKTLDLDVDIDSEDQKMIWIDESDDDAEKVIVIKIGSDGEFDHKILESLGENGEKQFMIKLDGMDGEFDHDMLKDLHHEFDIDIEEVDGETIIDIHKLLKDLDIDIDLDDAHHEIHKEIIIDTDGNTCKVKTFGGDSKKCHKESRLENFYFGGNPEELIEQEMIIFKSEDGQVETFDFGGDHQKIIEFRDGKVTCDSKKSCDKKKYKCETKTDCNKSSCEGYCEADKKKHRKRTVRKHHRGHHDFEIGFNAIWMDFDFEELNEVINGLGFSDIAENGVMYNGLDFSFGLGRGWKIGASGAWFKDEQSATVNNNPNHLEVKSHYCGLTIARADHLNKSFIIEGEMMLGAGKTSMEVAEVRATPSFNNPADNLTNTDHFKFANKYLVFRPALNMKYYFTPKLNLEGSVGYLKTIGGEWETEPFGYTVQGDEPDVPNGVNLSVGLSISL